MSLLELEEPPPATDTTTAFVLPTYDELSSRFRPIFERIAKDAVRREQSRELLYEAIEWLREAGFGAVRVPKEYGGAGATLPQLFRLLVELSEADSNLPQTFRAHFAFVEGRLNDAERDGSDIWFAKIVEGALFGAAMSERGEETGNTVTLTKDEDGNDWILNGTKYYSTGTIYADWIAASSLDGDEYVAVAVPVTSPGVTRVDDWDGFGQRLTGSGTTKFENVRVPDKQIIHRFSRGDGRAESYIKSFYQLVLLATLAGISRAVLRDGIGFVQPRTRQFSIPGKSSPRTDPLVQRVIGRVASLSFAAETLVNGIAETLEHVYQSKLAGTADEALYVSAEIKAFQAQQIVINLVLEAATLVFEVGGASATSETRRLDRHWRNARTVSSHNPAILRERAIGDYYLNGTTPDAAWREAFFKKNNAAKEKEPQVLKSAESDPN